MQDIEFTNTRFDPDLTPFHDLARQMAKAFGYTADLAFDKALAQLVRLRIAAPIARSCMRRRRARSASTRP